MEAGVNLRRDKDVCNMRDVDINMESVTRILAQSRRALSGCSPPVFFCTDSRRKLLGSPSVR